MVWAAAGKAQASTSAANDAVSDDKRRTASECSRAFHARARYGSTTSERRLNHNISGIDAGGCGSRDDGGMSGVLNATHVFRSVKQAVTYAHPHADIFEVSSAAVEVVVV